MTPESCKATEKALGRKMLTGEPFVCIIEELTFTLNEKEKALNNCRTIIEHARKGKEKRHAAIQELERTNEHLVKRNANQSHFLGARDQYISELERKNAALVEEIQGRSVQNDTIVRLRKCNLNQSNMIEERDEKISRLKNANKSLSNHAVDQLKIISDRGKAIKDLNERIDEAVNALEFGA